MNEIIKYLSPVAFLGIAWGILKFYQTRRFEKQDKIDEKKQIVINSIHSLLKDIEFETIKFMSSSSIPIQKENKELKASNISMKEELDKLENEYYKTRNQKQFTEENLIKLKSNLDKSRELLNSFQFNIEQSTLGKIEEFNSSFEKYTSILKLKIEELNKIQTLVLSEKSMLEFKIFKLTNVINSIIETYSLKNYIDQNGVINSDFTIQIKNIFNVSNSIKRIIEKDIKS